MVRVIKNDTPIDFIAGDRKALSIIPTLDGNPIPETTQIRLAVIGVSGVGAQQRRELIIPAQTAIYDAPNTRWIVRFTPAQTSLFYNDPDNPDSGLKVTGAELEAEIGEFGDLGTLHYSGLTVRRGWIT